jgi:anti-sigma regulatory factor (Ser/Thr protein kinase)
MSSFLASSATTPSEHVPWWARPSVLVSVEDASAVGVVRRAATTLAEQLGFDETDRGRAALAATELGTNLARHAKGGVVLVQPAPDWRQPAERVALELLAVDHGPGMLDPERCLRDGFSTGGTPGGGLGAIRRIADVFDIDSVPGRGTVVLARLLPNQGRPSGERAPVGEFEVGGVCVAAPGETLSGDGWLARRDGGRALVAVIDGLGHGPLAADAAATGLRVFAMPSLPNKGSVPVALLQRAHAALRATRGAAAAVAQLDPAAGCVRFGGLGNIAGMLLAAHAQPLETRSMVSHNGIVGHQASRFQDFVYPWRDDAIVVLTSDGIRTQWRLDGSPTLARRHPSVIAATIWRDNTRGRDDATVVVTRRAWSAA